MKKNKSPGRRCTEVTRAAAELSPLARVLWARLLCLHLDGLEDGLDTSPAAVIATAAARTA